MKILYLNGNLGAGGAEKLIYDIILNLKNMKCEVAILTEKNTIYKKKIEKVGIKVYALSEKNLYSLFNIFKLIKLIRKEKYDIVHVHTFPSLYVGAIASIFCKKTKFIYTEHSTHNRRRDKKILRKIEQFVYSRYEKIISITNSVENKLIDWLKDTRKEKYITIYNGIDSKTFERAKKLSKKEINNNIQETDILINMIGRFDRAKDQGTVIKSLQRLPQNYKLILIGEGILKKENEELVKKLKLEDRVYFLGFRRDVSSLLKNSDIVVLSSKWEGFGLVAVEAMAAKTPVLGTNVEGLKEIIADEELMFEVGNYNELAEKIIIFTQNKILRKKKIEFGTLRVKEFTIENTIIKYNKIYKNILENK